MTAFDFLYRITALRKVYPDIDRVLVAWLAGYVPDAVADALDYYERQFVASPVPAGRGRGGTAPVPVSFPAPAQGRQPEGEPLT
jgi:hypothetical protein